MLCLPNDRLTRWLVCTTMKPNLNDDSFIGVVRIVQIKDKGKYRAILNAAIRVMAEYGYHNAQISKIARLAGVADGTVYLYFKNKEDILVSILRETIEDIRQKVEDELANVTDPVDGLARLIAIHLSVLGQNQDLATVTQVHLRNSDIEVRKQIAEIMRPYQSIIQRLIEEAIRTGRFRVDLDPRIARRMVFGTLDETITAWILTGAKYDLQSLAAPILDALLKGCQNLTPSLSRIDREESTNEHFGVHEADV
jgi:TetR/AcrR family transcriptional regulator, fatty acid metabolism regulator protein